MNFFLRSNGTRRRRKGDMLRMCEWVSESPWVNVCVKARWKIINNFYGTIFLQNLVFCTRKKSCFIADSHHLMPLRRQMRSFPHEFLSDLIFIGFLMGENWKARGKEKVKLWRDGDECFELRPPGYHPHSSTAIYSKSREKSLVRNEFFTIFSFVCSRLTHLLLT